MSVAVTDELAAQLTASLRRIGLAQADEWPEYAALTGGVSSDIWLVHLRSGAVCVKRALPKLRVESDWYAPVDRWKYEVAWLRVVCGIAGEAVPKVLGVDEERRLFVMEFLDPLSYRPWKTELREGRADTAVASAVGRLVGQIHATTAYRPEIAAAFPTDDNFNALRLDPYLEATALRNPDLAANLRGLIRTTVTSKHALVHGDISPKNILLGPRGPVFLDAECAWYGDPAFDVAFCLNHLLLKCLWNKTAARLFLACFDSLTNAYMASVTWEPADEIDQRAAALLPGLLLARVDGKSPVEYLTDDGDKNQVRRISRALMASPHSRLIDVRKAWAQGLGIV